MKGGEKVRGRGAIGAKGEAAGVEGRPW